MGKSVGTFSSPVGGGGPPKAVEGVSPSRRGRDRSPSTMLRMVPLPLRVRRGPSAGAHTS